MAVKISGKGVVQTGTTGGTNIRLQGDNTGFMPFAQNATSTGLAFTISPGLMVTVSGSTFATGTLPDPSTFPGAIVMVSLTNDTCFLTGTAAATSVNTPGVPAAIAAAGITFQTMPTNKLGSTLTLGTGITLATSGSIALLSDGKYWTPFSASGSITLRA